jgi:hypothetical protein
LGHAPLLVVLLVLPTIPGRPTDTLNSGHLRTTTDTAPTFCHRGRSIVGGHQELNGGGQWAQRVGPFATDCGRLGVAAGRPGARLIRRYERSAKQGTCCIRNADAMFCCGGYA